MYSSTAALLAFASSTAESSHGPDLAKEAVRILAERLCMVCQMREAVHSQGRINESLHRVQQLASRLGGQQGASQQQQTQQQQQNTASSVSSSQLSKSSQISKPHDADEQRLNQPTPEADSTTSTQEVLATHRQQLPNGRPPPASAPASSNSVESLQRVLEHAKQVSRFASLLRRSPIGFQTFMERTDHSESQPAKLASMHIASISVDMGMVDGLTAIAHGHRARACIAALCR